jgi:hypothetical protein
MRIVEWKVVPQRLGGRGCEFRLVMKGAERSGRRAFESSLTVLG